MSKIIIRNEKGKKIAQYKGLLMVDELNALTVRQIGQRYSKCEMKYGNGTYSVRVKGK